MYGLTNQAKAQTKVHTTCKSLEKEAIYNAAAKWKKPFFIHE